MRSIRRCLNKKLAQICQHSVLLEDLSNKVSQLLPQDLAEHCQVGSFNKGCLLLTSTDAVWAAQLRYALPELRDKLRSEAHMYQLSSIKVIIVSPVVQYEKEPESKKEYLSEKARKMIISESQSCHYEPLKKALLHLAKGE